MIDRRKGIMAAMAYLARRTPGKYRLAIDINGVTLYENVYYGIAEHEYKSIDRIVCKVDFTKPNTGEFND